MTKKMPFLTYIRWAWLRAMKSSKSLMRRPFLPREVRYRDQRGRPRTGGGPMMHSLRLAGWVEQITVDGAMPMWTSGKATAWQITAAGRLAIEACPDEFPGGPNA